MPKTFDPTHDIPDLNGKVILVTGGNSGLGASTVRFFAEHNPRCIYLCARTRPTADAVVTSIHATNPHANVEILNLDVSSLDSVKECAAQFNERSDRLDILMLNAGISPTPNAVTKDGFEVTFGTNYVGHTLLTQLLLPKMLRTAYSGADVRIVSTASIGGQRLAPKGGIKFHGIKSPMESLSSTALYGQSKLAQILWTKKMADVYPQITSVSVHPGTVYTPINRGLAQKSPIMAWVINLLFRLFGVTADEGCKTNLWSATANKNSTGGVTSGSFYMPIGETMKESKDAASTDLRDRLWDWTEKELSEQGGPGWPKPQL